MNFGCRESLSDIWFLMRFLTTFKCTSCIRFQMLLSRSLEMHWLTYHGTLGDTAYDTRKRLCSLYDFWHWKWLLDTMYISLWSSEYLCSIRVALESNATGKYRLTRDSCIQLRQERYFTFYFQLQGFQKRNSKWSIHSWLAGLIWEVLHFCLPPLNDLILTFLWAHVLV